MSEQADLMRYGTEIIIKADKADNQKTQIEQGILKTADQGLQ